jgi:hypothetical protein
MRRVVNNHHDASYWKGWVCSCGKRCGTERQFKHHQSETGHKGEGPDPIYERAKEFYRGSY